MDKCFRQTSPGYNFTYAFLRTSDFENKYDYLPINVTCSNNPFENSGSTNG